LIEPIFTAGHTPGSACYLIGRTCSRAMFCLPKGVACVPIPKPRTPCLQASNI
jgi:hypothetical protein